MKHHAAPAATGTAATMPGGQAVQGHHTGVGAAISNLVHPHAGAATQARAGLKLDASGKPCSLGVPTYWQLHTTGSWCTHDGMGAATHTREASSAWRRKRLGMADNVTGYAMHALPVGA